MTAFIIRRLIYAAAAVVLSTMVVFTLSRLAGDPRNLYLHGNMVGQQQWEEWGREMGLDKPLISQYFIWLIKAMKGDWGESLVSGESAFKTVIRRVPATLQLSLAAFIFAVVTGVTLGILSAVKRSSVLDYIGRTFALFGQALPPFWLGLMLIVVFAVYLGWLPTSTRGGPPHYIMPAITLGWLSSAALLRLVRSAMLETLESEYVKLARAKGVSNWAVIWKHAFRNALIPPLTLAGLIATSFITGAVVTESVFAWPGMGRLATEAVFKNDFPVMTGAVLLFTAFFLGITLVVDIAYALIDPRIKYR